MSQSDSAVQTKLLHEWLPGQLEASLTVSEVGFIERMLLEVTIPGKYDELITVWRPLARWARRDGSKVEAKLLVEKAAAREKARQKAAAAAQTPVPAPGPCG